MKKSKTMPRPLFCDLRTNHGQAVIEYVLVLVITVTFVITLMNYFFKPFGEFISSYMGEYTACLLEYGELPTMGSEAPSPVEEEGECNARFQAATLSEGRPARPGGGNSSTVTKKNPSDKSSSSGGSGGGRSSGRSSSRPPRLIQGPRVADGPNSAASKTIEIEMPADGGGTFAQSNSQSYNRRPSPGKTTYVAITGLTAQEKEKLEKNRNGIGRTIATGETIAPPIKKIPVKKPPVKAVLEPNDDEWSIGNFIRILFIAALVIALVIFIGGQALQLSRGSEK